MTAVSLPSGFAAIEARGTIVVIEDEEAPRGLVRRMLEAEGYRVLEAADGERGLRLIEQHRVDLVLTDIQMPGIDGIQVAEALAAFLPLLPVICMSSSADTAVVEQRLHRAPRPFLPKPFTPGVLRQAVIGALTHHTQQLLARAQPQLTLALGSPAEGEHRRTAPRDLVTAARRLRSRRICH